MRHGDYDFGEHDHCRKQGSRALAGIPASVDAFVWLACYMAEGQPARRCDAIWWNLQGKTKHPLSYDGARAMFRRAQTALGSNWTLHGLGKKCRSMQVVDVDFELELGGTDVPRSRGMRW
ncbi:hypothetical protein ACVWY0_000846 [Arthrobacter sp. UYNi723]